MSILVHGETLSIFGTLQTLEAEAASLHTLPSHTAPGGLWPLDISRLQMCTTHQVLPTPGAQVKFSQRIKKTLSLDLNEKGRREEETMTLQQLSAKKFSLLFSLSSISETFPCVCAEGEWWRTLRKTKQACLAPHFNRQHKYQLLYWKCVSSSPIPTPQSPARTDHSVPCVPATSWTSFMSPITQHKC